MARPNPIREIMQAALPGRTYQRRLQFRPSDADIDYAYSIINRYCFDNQLKKPNIIQRSLHKKWGVCHWHTAPQSRGTWCRIELMDKWYCQQWFMNTLAHEMVHQYQWDIYRWNHWDQYGRDMPTDSAGHGPSFFAFRDRFAEYDLNLKTCHGMRRWFAHQDFARC